MRHHVFVMRPWTKVASGLVAVPLVLAGLLFVPAAAAGPNVSAGFSGGTGTATVAGSLYARSGQALTLTVTTSNDAQCVDVAGAFTAHQSSATGKTSWTFGLVPKRPILPGGLSSIGSCR